MGNLKCLLIHNYDLENGGVSILNYDFAEFLTNSNWQVTIFSPLIKFYKKECLFDLEWRFKNLEKLVYEADAILINLSPYLWKSYLQTIKLCQKYNKPYFIWFHVVLDENIYKKRYGKKNFEERKKILKEIFNDNLCLKVICVSQAVKDYLQDLNCQEKLLVVYPGVKIIKTKKSEICGDILYVGRFSEEKNLKVLIEAFKKLREDFSKIRLNLVGSGPEEEKLKKMIKKFNLEENVTFLGYRPREEIFSLYQSHKILVLPSKIESLGLVIIEAISQGLVPIVRETYGPKEILKNKNLFFENNKNDLYEKIKDVLKNYKQYQSIISNIKKETLLKFDYNKNFNLLEKIILENILFRKEEEPILKIQYSPIFV